jgi:hypothetical protein
VTGGEIAWKDRSRKPRKWCRAVCLLTGAVVGAATGGTVVCTTTARQDLAHSAAGPGCAPGEGAAWRRGCACLQPRG